MYVQMGYVLMNILMVVLGYVSTCRTVLTFFGHGAYTSASLLLMVALGCIWLQLH